MNLPQWNTAATSPAADLPDDGNSAPRLDALLPGTKLEEFEIERVLASSGFGVVYLAVEAQTERRVAIKEYLPLSLAVRGSDGARVELRAATHAEAFELGRRAFIDEALLLARLDHPSLVKVLGSWHANGTAYRAMPHYPGHTLLHLRQAMDEPPDEPSLRALLEGVLGALEVLHGAGTVHGDITPGNILLLPDDHPVLLDGGAARRAIVGENTRALMTLLQPSFAPPEQTAPAPERPVGAWTDLYSLAAVMHYSVSGQMPPAVAAGTPPAHKPLAAVVQAVRGRFPFLHFSRQFAAAIDAALAPDPAKRPRSVAEFRGLLDSEPPTELPAADDTAAREASNDPEIGPSSVAHRFEPELPAGDLRHDDAPIIHPSWPGARRKKKASWATWGVTAGLLLAVGAGGWAVLSEIGPGPEVLAQMMARRPPLATPSIAPKAVEPTPAPITTPAPAAPVAEAPVAAAPVAAAPVAVAPDAAPPVATPPVAAAAPAAALPDLPEAPTAAITPPPVAAPPVSATVTPRVAARRGATPAPASAKPVATAAAINNTKRQVARTPPSPREVCGERTQFSLYRCMQTQCAQPAFAQHVQCKRLRTRDEVE